MKFWDSSSIMPLLVPEAKTGGMVAEMNDDPAAAVWWATRVECSSALSRLWREKSLSDADRDLADKRLAAAAETWTEVPPIERVRQQALRMLRVHQLRAADSLQLAAALVLANFEPSALPFVTLDERLARAADREGFPVVSDI